MIEFLKIFLLGLIFWRVLTIFFNPTYLRDSKNKNLLRFDFGETSNLVISRVFLWQIVTVISTLVLIYVIDIGIQKSRYDYADRATPYGINIDSGFITRKGGYILREHAASVLTKSNMVFDRPLALGQELEIIGKTANEKWYKVRVIGSEEVGFIACKAVIEKNEAEAFIRIFIGNLAGNEESKKLACQSLIRWRGQCDNDFLKSPLYSGVISTAVDSIKSFKADNGKLVVTVVYRAHYNRESFIKLKQAKTYLGGPEFLLKKDIEILDHIRNGYESIGFRYTEKFYIMKLTDGSLAIWDHVLVRKSLSEEGKRYY